MKKHLPLILVLSLIAICLIVAFFQTGLHISPLEKRIAGLHPAVQKDIKTYVDIQPKLKVGDIVEVRNLDNLDSGRTLVVSKKVLDRIVLENGRAEGKPEQLILEPGIDAAVEMTNTYTFQFIQEGDPAYHATATWYFLQ